MFGLLCLVYYTLLIIAAHLLTLSVSLKLSYGFWPGMGFCGLLYAHSSSSVTASEIVSRECDSSKILNSSGCCVFLLFVMVLGMCAVGVV